jgi:hypothetical protein
MQGAENGVPDPATNQIIKWHDKINLIYLDQDLKTLVKGGGNIFIVLSL